MEQQPWACPAVIACEKCGQEAAVMNSRGVSARDRVRRQRECRCGHRFTTYELRASDRLTSEELDRAVDRLERAVSAAITVLAKVRTNA